MPTNRDACYAACIALAPRPARIPEAFERLAPFFDQADADHYALCTADELDLGDAADAIARASRLPVPRVVPVSLAEPLPRPPWMGSRQYDTLVTDGLISSFRDPLSPTIAARAEAAKERLGLPLWHAFTEHLGNALCTSLENCVPDALKVPLSLHHGMALWHRLFLYLASAASADASAMTELGPLVSLSARALPLGEKRDEPGTWLVLVA